MYVPAPSHYKLKLFLTDLIHKLPMIIRFNTK